MLFGNALGKVLNTAKPNTIKEKTTPINSETIRTIINNVENGYLQPQQVKELLIAAEIPIVQEIVCKTITECISAIKELQFPVVMKDSDGNTYNVFGKATDGPRKGHQLQSHTGFFALLWAFEKFYDDVTFVE